MVMKSDVHQSIQWFPENALNIAQCLSSFHARVQPVTANAIYPNSGSCLPSQSSHPLDRLVQRVPPQAWGPKQPPPHPGERNWRWLTRPYSRNKGNNGFETNIIKTCVQNHSMCPNVNNDSLLVCGQYSKNLWTLSKENGKSTMCLEAEAKFPTRP